MLREVLTAAGELAVFLLCLVAIYGAVLLAAVTSGAL